MGKLVRLFIDRFDKITKKEYIDDYKDIRKAILNKCINNNSYKSIDYVNLEIERIKLRLGMENSQYISIIYSVAIFIIPIVATIILKLTNVELEKVNEHRLVILSMYLFIAVMIFIILMMNKTRNFKCCTIYLTVLEELKKDLENK